MSEHLKTARHWMTEADKGRMQSGVPTLDDLGKAVWRIILHLESRAAQTAESPAQSASSSSPGIRQAVETKPTYSTSSTLLFPVKASGDPVQLALQGIVGWFNSHQIPGVGLEVETGAIRLLRDATPLSGSASPSTEEPSPSPSGAPGTDAAGIPPQAGREWRYLTLDELDKVVEEINATPEQTQAAAPEPRYYVIGRDVYDRRKPASTRWVATGDAGFDAARICDLLNAAERGE